MCLLAVQFSAPARAQDAARQDSTNEPVQLSADRLEGGIGGDGQEVQRLIGNVVLRQGATTLTAREAINHAGRGEYEFFGDVRIVDEGDTLWADHVFYDTNTKVGRASPDVQLSDGEVRLRAPNGVYFVDEKRAELEGGVTMVDSTATLTSRRGRYWMDEKRAEFYEDVRLVEQESVLEADSVTYHRETEISLARGNVAIEHEGGRRDDAAPDTTMRTLLFGAEAFNDTRAGFSRITGEPLLVRLTEDSTGAPADTLVIRARVLESTRTDTLERLVAMDSVRIWRAKLAAVADSAVSDRFTAGDADSSATREEIRLFQGPVVWYKDLEVFGDTILARGQSGSIDSMFVKGSAFTARMDTSTGNIQQLRGGSLVAVFDQDSLRSMTAETNVESVYFQTNEEGGTDAVQASGDLVHFLFRDDELRKIHWVGEVEGTMYPQGLIPEPLQLEGYRWEPERRPQKEQLLQRNGRTLVSPPEVPVITSAEGQ